MPPAHVLSMNELAVRRAAAWWEYQRDHVPGITRRQVFTGGDMGVKEEQTARSHALTENMRLANDDMARDQIRSGVKKFVNCMRGRNRYFAKYTKMVTIQPAGNEKLTSTTSNDAIDSRPSCLRSERHTAVIISQSHILG
jgi:hypothetical protein